MSKPTCGMGRCIEYLATLNEAAASTADASILKRGRGMAMMAQCISSYAKLRDRHPVSSSPGDLSDDLILEDLIQETECYLCMSEPNVKDRDDRGCTDVRC